MYRTVYRRNSSFLFQSWNIFNDEDYVEVWSATGESSAGKASDFDWGYEIGYGAEETVITKAKLIVPECQFKATGSNGWYKREDERMKTWNTLYSLADDFVQKCPFYKDDHVHIIRADGTQSFGPAGHYDWHHSTNYYTNVPHESNIVYARLADDPAKNDPEQDAYDENAACELVNPPADDQQTSRKRSAMRVMSDVLAERRRQDRETSDKARRRAELIRTIAHLISVVEQMDAE